MTRTERILVCCGTGCIANGAYEVARALEEQIAAQGANAQVELKICRTGCSGECEQGPLVRLMPRDTMYYKVKPADALPSSPHSRATRWRGFYTATSRAYAMSIRRTTPSTAFSTRWC